MRIKIFLKKLMAISVAALLAVTLAGCFDLGDFSDESAYYAAFGDVGLVYQDPDAVEKDIQRDDYSVQDYFYNKNTGESFTYGAPKDDESDEGKDIPKLAYNYMLIPLNQDMEIESLALYFNATQTCTLEVVLYVVDTLPDGGDFSDIRLLGEPEYQQKFDDEGNPYQELIEYSDPDDSLIVARTSVGVKANEWVSLFVDSWAVGESVQIKESQYVLLRFINNCGVSTGENPSVSFRVTNLLIRGLF